MISTVTPATDPAPEFGVWELPFFLRSNWSEGVSLASSWNTEVRMARSVAERRVVRASKPSRTLSATFSVFRKNELRSATNLLRRVSSARTIWPLYMDRTRVTAVNGSTLTCETGHRRLYDGRWAVLAVLGRGGIGLQYGTAEIASVGVNSVTLASVPISGTPLFLYPGIEMDIVEQPSVNLRNSVIGDIRIDFIESIGDTALPPLTDGSFSEWGTHESLPILPLFGDWSNNRIGFSRELSRIQSGLAEVTDVFGSRPRYSFSARFGFLDRSSAWTFLKFVDSRRGRAYPFFLVSKEEQLELLTSGTSSVDVEAIGPVEDWTHQLYLWGRVGSSYEVRTISSVNRVSSTDTVNLSTPFSSAPDKVGLAFKCRFSSEEVQEDWITDSICFADASFEEVLEEKVVTLGSV